MTKRKNQTTLTMRPGLLARYPSGGKGRPGRGAGPSRSELIERDLEAYAALLDWGLSEAKRVVTRREALAIIDAQNGTMLEPLAAWLQGGLAHQLADAVALDHLDRKWEIDGAALVAKLRAMPAHQTMALLDWARRYWESDPLPEPERLTTGFIAD